LTPTRSPPPPPKRRLKTGDSLPGHGAVPQKFFCPPSFCQKIPSPPLPPHFFKNSDASGPIGIPSASADSQLTLFFGRRAIGTKDNWGGEPALTAAFAQVGAFALPAASRDAALLATLQPGAYTVQARGVSGTTGVALVEIYEVP
jgi:hypothetical protein